MLSLKEKIRLVDELIEEDKDSSIKDFSLQVMEIEYEIKQIEQSESED